MHIEETFQRFLHSLRHHRGRAAGPHPPLRPDEHAAVHEIFQLSTITSLLEGVYDGEVTYGQLRAHGDFGLGTFNALDGEMIGFDGQFYQVRADGLAREVSDDQKTPFATVLFFRPSIQQDVDQGLDLAQLKEYLDGIVGSPNLFFAVRIDASFEHVTTRSVPRQEKPYRHLAEVARDQPTFELTNVRGTLVGFRFPDYAQGVNVPGYHLHFLTDDRRAGGHVLDLKLSRGRVAIDPTSQFHLTLPDDVEFLRADLSGDHQDDLHASEEAAT
jgi:acetolactate decarboxylase